MLTPYRFKFVISYPASIFRFLFVSLALMAFTFTLYSPLSLRRPSLSHSSPRLFTLSTSLPKLKQHSTQIHCASKSNKQQSKTQTTPGFDPNAGVALYKPKSYEVLVTDAANSLAYALEGGKTRVEIDFP